MTEQQPDAPPHRQSTQYPTLRKPRRLDWLLLASLLCALVILLDRSGLLARPNYLLQDSLVRLQADHQPSHPIIIVAIDDKSVAALGQWPWSRSLHAQVIDRINQAGAKVIGIDVLFAEPSADPASDAALAASVRREANVVLPIFMQNVDGTAVETGPVPVLREAAAALGHVHLDVDVDGVARAVFLCEGLFTEARGWPHFTLAMQQLAQKQSSGCLPPPGPSQPLWDAAEQQLLGWWRDHRMVIPFAGPPLHFPRVSYVDVLKGRVPPTLLHNAYVLVGATAAGLGDLYATPVSSRPELMPGVEISANVLNGLLGGQEITPLSALANSLLNTVFVLLALAGFAYLGPASALVVALLLVIAPPALAAVLLLMAKMQFSPAAGMIGVAFAYAIWSWRRLDRATRYFIDELDALRQATSLGRWGDMPSKTGSGDFLDRRIQALDLATRHLRDLYQLLDDSLENLPDATLACDLDGRIVLANHQAATLFDKPTARELIDQAIEPVTSSILTEREQTVIITMPALLRINRTQSVPARTPSGRDLLVKIGPARTATGLRTGWLVSLIDISEMRQAQRQRDEAIRFLGHDIRSPQASILALIELRRHAPAQLPSGEFEERVGRHARKTLELADDFIHLVRAQSYRYQLAPLDLAGLFQECIDDFWAQAQQSRLRIELGEPEEQLPMAFVDQELLSRAIGNLIGNALKFAPPHSVVHCAIRPANQQAEAYWELSVRDQGPGIPLAQQPTLFEPFKRVPTSSPPHAGGAGLGLAFVQTVAERHGGWVHLISKPGEGAQFSIVLPVHHS